MVKITDEWKEKINKLAGNLKKSGLAASLDDAVRLAKNMLMRQTTDEKAEIKFFKKETPEKQDPRKEEKKDIKINEPEPKIQPEEVAPEKQKRLDDPGYDITKEEKTVKELLAEDAEQIYNFSEKPVQTEEESKEHWEKYTNTKWEERNQ